MPERPKADVGALTVDAHMSAYRAARGWAAQHGHPQPDDRMIGAALAAFLPVHREMVGREIFNALSEEIAWQREKYGDGTDRAATGRLIGMEDAATTVRRLAVSAPPTPPGSPPADERATAVETGTVERPFVPCELGVAGDWCALPIEHAGSCDATVAVPGTGDDPPSCDRCRRPFDPADKDAAGAARYGESRFCRGCVDRCHESTDAFHECPVCAS